MVKYTAQGRRGPQPETEAAVAELRTVCKAGEIPDGDSTVVTVNNKDVAVFFTEGKYFAIDDMCPHAAASLSSGFVEEGVVTCPWHGWRFRLCDGAWADNPRVKTGCYAVQVNDGLVQIEVPPPKAAP